MHGDQDPREGKRKNRTAATVEHADLTPSGLSLAARCLASPCFSRVAVHRGIKKSACIFGVVILYSVTIPTLLLY